jgi:hypothetical protein
MKTKTIIGYIVVIVITIIVIKLWCCPKCPGNTKTPGIDSCCTAADKTLPAGYTNFVGAAAINAKLATYNPVTDDSTRGAYIPREVIKYFNCLECDSVYAMFVIDITGQPTVMYICDSLGIIKNIGSGETGGTCPTKCP